VNDFNDWMEHTSLAPKIGRSALELLLHFIGLESCREYGVTYWIGIRIDEPDPLADNSYVDPAFPKIFA
jgi:hypothetical protein